MEVDDVIDVLKGYHFNVITKEDALEALEGVPTINLYLAEIELMADGLKEADIKEIGKLYVELLQGESKKLQEQLEEGHPVLPFIKEHEKIGEFLSSLDKISSSLRSKAYFMEDKVICTVIDNLYQITLHINREEQTLFVELRRVLGNEMEGRLNMLAKEHNDFVERRDRLEELFDNGTENRYQLIRELNALIYSLHHHKFIEDHLFYPVAAHYIKYWDDLKKKADDIGYCEFIPIPS